MITKIDRDHAILFIYTIIKPLFRLFFTALFKPRNTQAYASNFAELYSRLWDAAEHSISNQDFELPSTFSKGPIQHVNELLKKLYGGRFASLSFGGSSGALLTLLTAVLPKLRPEQDLILFDENCHQSTIGGLIFGRWKAVRIPRIIDEKHGTVRPIQFQTVKNILETHGAENFAAIILVLPSYDGFRAQSEELKIYAYAKSKGIPVIVDGAWDATHFRLSSQGAYPLKNICDVWITSPHKRGLCPSSLGCVVTEREDIAKLWDAALDLGFRSSSISFVEIMVAEHRLNQIVEGAWEEAFRQAESAAADLRQRIQEVHRGLYIVEPHHVYAESVDPTHILISTSNIDRCDARIWAQNLAEHFALDVEKSTPTTLLLLCASPLHKRVMDQTIWALRESLLMTLQTTADQIYGQ